MRIIGIIAAGAFLSLLSSCATVTRGTKDVLVIESEPPGANVTTSNGLASKTPATFKVSRKGGFTVTIEKEGYEPITVQVTSRVAGAGAAGMAGNVVLGGLIGAAVDAGTGATKELKPNPIKVTLVPLKSSHEKAENAQESINSTTDSHEATDSDKEESETEKANQTVSFEIQTSPLGPHKMQVSVTELG